MSTSVILGFRQGQTPERARNLFAVLRWLAGFPAFQVIVVEQDDCPRLDALPHPGCQLLFAYNPGPFNKSWGMNVGARHAQGAVLVFSDADLVVPLPLDDLSAICRSEFAVVKPYCRLVDLGPAQTQSIHGGETDFAALAQPGALHAPGYRPHERISLCSGMFMIRREAFFSLGGWDERFVGWGGEDDALSYKVQHARLSCFEADKVPALHLWHPRPADGPAHHPQYAGNLQLLRRYHAYSEGELGRLAEVQAQLMGYREKYRPAA